MPSLTMTGAARAVLDEVRRREGARLLFVIGGGCCDNTAPMLLKDFRLGAADVHMGDVDGVPVYCETEQTRLMAASHLEIGVSSGGGNSFSLEIPLGKRFVLRTSPTRAAAKE